MRFVRTSMFLGAIILASFLSTVAFATGPISAYYLTAGDQGTNWVVQGGSVINSWAQQHSSNGGEYAIAVSGGLVRTLGNGVNGDQGLGSQYTLAGSYTGTAYTYPLPGTAGFFDGTTDGSFNYSVDFSNGGVYRMNLNWSNPTLLFSTPANDLGITYDPLNSSLWVSTFTGTNVVADYSLSGTLLSSFYVPFNKITCLALDPADGTLWMGSQTTEGTFYQYSTAGAELSTQSYSSLADQNTLGGEFQVVPEPTTIGLVAVGGLALGLAVTWRPRERRRT